MLHAIKLKVLCKASTLQHVVLPFQQPPDVLTVSADQEW